MYSHELKEKAVALRLAEHSLNEISRELNIAKGTASIWLRDVEISEEAQDRLQKRLRMGQEQLSKHVAKRFRRAREKAYAEGLTSNPTPVDALCIGLYWGEGAKYKGTWVFVNSDRDQVSAMVQWAIRAGQPAGMFRAQVQVHLEDTLSEDEVREHWSQAGIPTERIIIYRVPSRAANQRTHNRIPCGTCQLYPIRNGATLYEYYGGQRDRLLGFASAPAA